MMEIARLTRSINRKYTNNITLIRSLAYRKNLTPRDRRPIVVQQRKRNEELDKKALDMKLDWRIMGATVLHRYPTITKDMEPWEIEYDQMQEERDSIKRELLMKEIGGTESQIFPDDNPSYEEIIETLPFKPAPRFTVADETNDRKSLERRLQDSLFLVVKRNRNDRSWQFPQGKIRNDDVNGLRSTAERVVDRAVGKTKRWFMSNAPIGHYCYEYPDAVKKQRNNFGAKVFFYRAQYILGTVKLETKLYTDYAWVARDELKEYLDPEMVDFAEHLVPY